MRRRISILCTLFALLLTLNTGCLRNTVFFKEPATIISSNYFAVTKKLPPQLQAKLPTDVVSYNPQQPARNSILPEQFSHIVFDNLSLNFLWTGAQHNLPIDGTTYSAMPSAGQIAKHNGTELTITSEFCEEKLSLIAILDWNNTGSTDWLVAYTFKSLVQPEISKRLLLVRDIQPNTTLTATVLSASECFGNNCQYYTGNSLVEFLEYQPQY
ncbi:hypothetical protein [Halodesulfovibrio marinisediminis]|uniref:Lipoprotein n=1 Tax=Halodesulfovibrio marinisediminis DSM 17456 TaxID=1121457 RepID=A0A1N6IJK9_9BACT|nr:hypothetical protein [Halodesulfovibrio marinisediminis]SIO32202.1 hypothetical protein SAMN02745161_2812 [Halodesulfovibrio marinisediminis DSM 17456]